MQSVRFLFFQSSHASSNNLATLICKKVSPLHCFLETFDMYNDTNLSSWLRAGIYRVTSKDADFAMHIGFW